MSGGPSGNFAGIAYRPATGDLFALDARDNLLYTINPATGVATQRATLSAAPGSGFAGLQGSSFGLAFDPRTDLAGLPSLRVVDNAGQNLRVQVAPGPGGAAGEVFRDVDLHPNGTDALYVGVREPSRRADPLRHRRQQEPPGDRRPGRLGRRQHPGPVQSP